MSEEFATQDRVDTVRRKLLRSSAVIGGGLALGHLPYQRPAVKSFFGVRSAWAQPSVGPMCGNVVIVPSKSVQAASTSFSVQNIGLVPFAVTGVSSSNPAFSPVVNLPVNLAPQAILTVPVNVNCTTPGVQTTTVSVTTESEFGSANCPDTELSVECELCCSITPSTPIELSPDFCNDQAGALTAPSFTIANCGDVPFAITALTPSRGFAVFPISPSMIVGSTLNPGDSAEVGVQFCEVECEGDVNGTVTVVTDPATDCGPVQLVGLCGPLQ